ncbi:unnamed protein product [Didymodactylos carnosus]|uniref:NHL repeat-containing protein n=1 Tax=Didymodactylos carnosus TaxID=1234261 RepID=A0A815GAU4_9BILA|nr:unnamed protein product [Didymodactylos carnosus]CAF4193182.1 unnamed protein product [Didymodactylos carnosus]
MKLMKGATEAIVVAGGAEQGDVIVGGNGEGKQANRLHYPAGLSFDRHGNLYVIDKWNHRVQRFSIDDDAEAISESVANNTRLTPKLNRLRPRTVGVGAKQLAGNSQKSSTSSSLVGKKRKQDDDNDVS